MMVIPTLLYSAGMLGRAPLFEGDVRKEMTCVTCDGLGRTAKEETCTTCRGRGVADFIIPGPNRPIQMIGTVLGPDNKPVEGAEIAARQAEGDTTELFLETNPEGQFGIKLPPGDYVVRVSAQGVGSVQESLVIKQDPNPLPARSLDTHHKLNKEFKLQRG
jgi:hypothetical protein